MTSYWFLYMPQNVFLSYWKYTACTSVRCSQRWGSAAPSAHASSCTHLQTAEKGKGCVWPGQLECNRQCDHTPESNCTGIVKHCTGKWRKAYENGGCWYNISLAAYLVLKNQLGFRIYIPLKCIVWGMGALTKQFVFITLVLIQTSEI